MEIDLFLYLATGPLVACQLICVTDRPLVFSPITTIQDCPNQATKTLKATVARTKNKRDDLYLNVGRTLGSWEGG